MKTIESAFLRNANRLTSHIPTHKSPISIRRQQDANFLEVSKHETAVYGTACTVVWEDGKHRIGGKHSYQRLLPTQLIVLV